MHFHGVRGLGDCDCDCGPGVFISDGQLRARLPFLTTAVIAQTVRQLPGDGCLWGNAAQHVFLLYMYVRLSCTVRWQAQAHHRRHSAYCEVQSPCWLKRGVTGAARRPNTLGGVALLLLAARFSGAPSCKPEARVYWQLRRVDMLIS